MSANETIHVSATGGQKAGNHVRVGLIPTQELLEVAELYGRGAAKYSDGNWRKGYPWHLSFDALCRHLFAWWGGEEFDNGEGGTGQEHLDCVIFHALALKWFRKHRPQFDDRPTTLDAAEATQPYTGPLDDTVTAALAYAATPPCTPRVVDSLGENERHTQWHGPYGHYRWNGRWERLSFLRPDEWLPTSCHTRDYGPYTETQPPQPRIVQQLGDNERDAAWVDRDHDDWAWRTDATGIRSWHYRDHAHGGQWTSTAPNYEPGPEHGPFTEVLA